MALYKSFFHITLHYYYTSMEGHKYSDDVMLSNSVLEWFTTPLFRLTRTQVRQEYALYFCNVIISNITSQRIT